MVILYFYLDYFLVLILLLVILFLRILENYSECSFNDLYNMIDRASLLTSDREKNTIKLSLKGNELMISSNSPEIGKRGKNQCRK